MTTISLDSIADNYINSYSTTTNYGTDTMIVTGENDTATDRVNRILIKFDLSSIPKTAVIDSAVVSLYNYSDKSSNTRNMRFYRVKRAWVETQSTWTIYKTGSNWSTAGCGSTSDRETTDIGYVSMGTTATGAYVDITLNNSAIQEMVNGNFVNNGFVIIMDTELNDLQYFYSRENASSNPYMTITYHMPSQVVMMM